MVGMEDPNNMNEVDSIESKVKVDVDNNIEVQ